MPLIIGNDGEIVPVTVENAYFVNIQTKDGGTKLVCKIQCKDEEGCYGTATLWMDAEKARFGNDEWWINSTMHQAIGVLQDDGIAHGEFPTAPAFHAVPVLTLWFVPGETEHGYYVLAGRVPPDYEHWTGQQDARSALRRFAQAWEAEAAALDEAGEKARPSPDPAFPTAGDWARHQACVVREIAEDDARWR